ncbi:40519_t:CDS:2 [Gigaspora margarita]|uniref:40519_t:CDS:1 n=1 Tax=Gigaspora margarita TaxID=4874 RepID=A0ABM8W0M8_GIGMA|nr:40519_t:CDS:2 [Gigaspora margarita]
MSSTFGRIYNITSISEHIYNETSTPARVYNENILNTRFINEAQTLLNPEEFKILRDKVSSDQEHFAKNLEDYWNKVIYEYNIVKYKQEKERVIRMLSEIEEKIKMKENDLIKSSDEWKHLLKIEAHLLCKRKHVQANNLGVNHNDIGDNNDLVDNNENGDDNASLSNNDFEKNMEPQSPPDIATTTVVTMSSSSQTQRYNLRKRKRVDSSSSSQAQTYNF